MTSVRTRTGAVIALASAIALASTDWNPNAHAVTSQVDVLRSADAPANAIWLDSVDLTKMVQRRGTPRAGAYGGGSGRGAPSPLSLANVVYPHGIGTLSINELIVNLKGQATRFVSMVGIDDAAREGQGSVTVEVWVDNKKAFISDVIKAGDPPRLVDVNLERAQFLELLIDDRNDVSTGDYADWAGALIYLKPGATAKPESWSFPSEAPPPIASGWPAAPRINPPRITGGTPGRPFLFRIPATGEAPLAFSARPAGGAHARPADWHHLGRDRA